MKMSLKISLPSETYFIEETNQFIESEQLDLELTHSLVSASKWESLFKKPFLQNEQMETNEIVEYVRCMSSISLTINEATRIAVDNLEVIKDYIKDTNTATVIYSRNNKKTSNNEILTTELIYYYMAAFGLDISCENWHLSRLLTLLAVANVKQSGDENLPEKEVIMSDSEMNERRKALLKTKG